MTVDVGEVRIEAEQMAEEQAWQLAREWFSAAQDALLRTGEVGVDQDYETWPVAQSGIPPQEVDGDPVFGFEHHAAQFLNDGTEPHVIRAKEAEMLAFEWPDAPQEVRDMFEATFPTVFFKEIDHPGTRALRYMERGADEVTRR